MESAQDIRDMPKRLPDRRRGFAYLQAFDELRDWDGNDADPVHRSNTPLTKRPEHADEDKKSKILLIHDYAGGYLDYETCQGSNASKEMYSCEQLQLIDSFVYFSHQLVTIPPPTWINTCHRNGVQVLGTFIVEPDTLKAECILDVAENGFWVASQLARIARCYGFDGWLVNIEKSFHFSDWSCDRLERFLKQLREDLGPGCQVIWYDALTTLNVVWHQNTLNYLNLRFALAAGSMLTNYAWTLSMAKQARSIAERSGLGLSNVYFGIDVWAQNIQQGHNRRVTYPSKGGGGTSTGFAVRKLASHGLPAGIFAPAWSYEHFPTCHKAAENAMWLGYDLPTKLVCECQPDTPHITGPYWHHPIKKYAKAYPAGSESFFHTDFVRVFASRSLRHDDPSDQSLNAHVGRQSILPTRSLRQITNGSPPNDRLNDAILRFELKDGPPRSTISVRFNTAQALSPKNALRATLHLFDLSISDKSSLEVCITYKKPVTTGSCVKLLVGSSTHNEMVLFPDEAQDFTTTKMRISDDLRPIKSLDVLFEGSQTVGNGEGMVLIELLSLTVRRCEILNLECSVLEPRIEWLADVKLPLYRLIWDISPASNGAVDNDSGMPYSSLTGAFAYFQIYINSEEIGTAYALEFILSDDTIARLDKDKAVTVEIEGIGFDGSLLHVMKEHLTWPDVIDDGWVVVDPARNQTRATDET